MATAFYASAFSNAFNAAGAPVIGPAPSVSASSAYSNGKGVVIWPYSTSLLTTSYNTPSTKAYDNTGLSFPAVSAQGFPVAGVGSSAPATPATASLALAASGVALDGGSLSVATSLALGTISVNSNAPSVAGLAYFSLPMVGQTVPAPSVQSITTTNPPEITTGAIADSVAGWSYLSTPYEVVSRTVGTVTGIISFSPGVAGVAPQGQSFPSLISSVSPATVAAGGSGGSFTALGSITTAPTTTSPPILVKINGLTTVIGNWWVDRANHSPPNLNLTTPVINTWVKKSNSNSVWTDQTPSPSTWSDTTQNSSDWKRIA